MASTATPTAPAAPERVRTRGQERQFRNGRWDTRPAVLAERPSPTPKLGTDEIADAVAVLVLMCLARASGRVRPERWRLAAVTLRLLVAQMRSDRSSTIRVGTHWFDRYRLLPALRRDTVTDRRPHHEHARRALLELERAGLVRLTTVYDAEGQEQATDVQLLPCPELEDVDVSAATSTIKRWYDRYPAEWRRPLQPGRGWRARRAKKPAPVVVVDANVPPALAGPPATEDRQGGPPCRRSFPDRAGEVSGNARERETEETAASPRFGSVDGSALLARHASNETSKSTGFAVSVADPQQLPASQLPMSSPGLGREVGPDRSGHLDGLPGRLEGSAPLAEASSPAGAEIDQEAPRVPDLDELIPPPLRFELHRILDEAGLLGWRVEPDGSDGLGRLSVKQRRRLARDIAAWPSRRARLGDGWDQMDAGEALVHLANWAAYSGHGSRAGRPSGRGVWTDYWLTSYERQHSVARVPLAILARKFHQVCKSIGRDERRKAALLPPTSERVAQAIADRPAWLSSAADPSDHGLVRCGELNAMVRCDWIPWNSDEVKAAARSIATIWAALHGTPPTTARLYVPETGDWVLIKLREAQDDRENEPPREPIFRRGRR